MLYNIEWRITLQSTWKLGREAIDMLTAVILIVITYYSVRWTEEKREGKTVERKGELLMAGMIFGGVMSRWYPEVFKGRLGLDMCIAIACAFVGLLLYWRVVHLSKKYHAWTKSYSHEVTFIGKSILVVESGMLLAISTLCTGVALRGAFLITTMLDQAFLSPVVTVSFAGLLALVCGAIALAIDTYQTLNNSESE